MTELKEFLTNNAAESLAIGGFLIGLAFGYLTHRANYCTMGSIANWITIQDARGMRSWTLAAAIAIVGVSLMAYTGVVDLTHSFYTAPRINWAAQIIGGLIFGFGMVLAGGCASRNVVRAGGGDLRAAITIAVASLFASITNNGVLGPVRAAIEQSTAMTMPLATQRMTDMAASMGATSIVSNIGLPLLIALALVVKCFTDEPFRQSRRHLAVGIGLGLLVTAAWALTGLAYDELADRVQPPTGLSFVKPAADTFDWLQRSTALGLPGFGVATIFGTFAGASLSAFWNGRFQIMTYADRADTVRNLTGAALMGIGGVLALGCSIGQGISGVATLSLGSMLAAAAIVAGNILGIRVLQIQEA